MTAPAARTLVDLSHPVEEGMMTYPGLPGPRLWVHRSREQYEADGAGTTFEISGIDMVGNTGTYLDAPWHRFAGGTDLAGLPLAATADLPALVADARRLGTPGITAGHLQALTEGREVAGHAVLVLTGWDRNWRTEAYGDAGAPFLDASGTAWLVEHGAALVGIDSVNIDDMADSTRPAHTGLLAAGIPVVEHLTGLDRLPAAGARFHAAPLPVLRFGTSPVRAYAVVNAGAAAADDQS